MIEKYKQMWRECLEKELTLYASDQHIQLEKPISLVVQKPPKADLGDLAFPFFAFAKLFRTSPHNLVETIIERVESSKGRPIGRLVASGPYVNVFLDSKVLGDDLFKHVHEKREKFGHTRSLQGRRVMVEFSCPNTNKPLHLGHLRNDALGQSISALLKANGAEVHKVNLINNRGVHICKSMLAYQKYGKGETPESSKIKGDHLVGDYYVKFAQWEKEDPEATTLAQQMLKKWEQGDTEVLDLWEQMNRWTLDGIGETYERTGVSFDRYYYESDTYTLGRDIVLEGLEKGIFYKEEDGSIWVDLEEIKLDKKVLLRKDGTSLYLTQDIGTAISRHEDWPFDSLTYVVASEQSYHFTVLFYVLKKLGYSWAQQLHHLAYGMVNLPDGKMKSREGNVVDADDLLDQLSELARSEIVAKEREDMVDDVDKTSEAIALGALNYYLLQVNPLKDMVFNPAESISFNGNTGPYLQYMGARISSMVKTFNQMKEEYTDIAFDASRLSLSEERELMVLLASFSEVVDQAAKELNPSLVTTYLYDLSRLFSRYYHEYPILKLEDKVLVKARFTLVSMVLQVFKNAYDLVGIPFLESM
jgi:arginyl-tRNA synthetase